jgi:uncharacterized membrane protein HdeD (DUF308 family)
MTEKISMETAAQVLREGMHPFPNWHWVLASGCVGFLAAVVSWSKLPATAIWILCPSLGILLISEGAAIGYLAWPVRKQPDAP